MEKINIKEEQLKMIQSESFDKNFWYYQLGISISNVNLSSENQISFDFYRLGKEYWEKTIDNLKYILCDRNNKAPNPDLDELLNGDVRNLIVYLISFLVTKSDIVLGLAIPLVALIIKEGIKDFCLRS
jgi:hypothetical protein